MTRTIRTTVDNKDLRYQLQCHAHNNGEGYTSILIKGILQPLSFPLELSVYGIIGDYPSCVSKGKGLIIIILTIV